MMFGIFRVGKAKAGDLGGLEAEANRTEKDKKDFPASMIDWSKTDLNEFLVKTIGWKRSVEDLIKEKGCRVRSNSTYIIDCIFTASPEFFKTAIPEEQDAFFHDCLDFCKNHLGIVKNAVIHRDETTPHMHVACVPLVDRGNGKFSLSAKDILGGNQDMHRLQDAAFHEIFEKYDLERGEVRDPATRREHLDVLDFKLKAREEEVKAAEAEKFEIEQDIGKLERIREIISDVKNIALDFFARVSHAVREGFIKLCDKIEHNQDITADDLKHADCKMTKTATYTNNDGEKLPLYSPKTANGEPLSWDDNRPIYGEEDNTYFGICKMDKDHNFTAIDDKAEWQNTFNPARRDFDSSVCERDIVSLEERIDQIDQIVNDDIDPFDCDYEDQDPPEEIDYSDADDILSFDPTSDDDDDPDDFDPVCV